MITEAERELMVRIRCQQVLGYGMFVNDVEFKAWACREYGIPEDRLTQLMRESI